jgi:hypothetical protein
MIHLDSAAPAFIVSDVGATIQWYADNLGFTAYPFPAKEPYVFAILQRDRIEIMLQRIEGYQKPGACVPRACGTPTSACVE